MPELVKQADVSCGPSSGDSFSVQVNETGGRQLQLTINIDSGYSGVGTYASGVGPSSKPAALSVKLALPGAKAGATPTTSARLPVMVTVDKDRKQGTVDAQLATVADPVDAVERVHGNWACP